MNSSIFDIQFFAGDDAFDASDDSFVNNAADNAVTESDNADTGADAADEGKGKTLVAGDDGKGDKSQDDGNEAEKETAKGGEKADGALESYRDFVLPKNIALDADTMTEFKALAKEMNLSQEKAQKLVDLQTKLVQKENELINQRFEKLKQDWRNETLQALGANKAQELAYVAKAREQFATPELIQILDGHGLGDNKEFVMFFARIGKALADDKFVSGSKGGGGKLTAAQILYPDSK